MINESLSKSAKAILPYNQTAIRTNDHILTIAKILRWSCMQHEESREKVTKGSSSGIFSYGISRGQLTLATNLSANVLVTLNAWRAGGGLGPCRKAPWNLMHTRFPSGKKEFLATSSSLSLTTTISHQEHQCQGIQCQKSSSFPSSRPPRKN